MDAEKARNLAQCFNRDKWVDNSVSKIEAQIEYAAKHGLRGVSVDVKDFVIGAENLVEAQEMLQLVNKTLSRKGFSVEMTPDAEVMIYW